MFWGTTTSILLRFILMSGPFYPRLISYWGLWIRSNVIPWSIGTTPYWTIPILRSCSAIEHHYHPLLPLFFLSERTFLSRCSLYAHFAYWRRPKPKGLKVPLSVLLIKVKHCLNTLTVGSSFIILNDLSNEDRMVPLIGMDLSMTKVVVLQNILYKSL